MTSEACTELNRTVSASTLRTRSLTVSSTTASRSIVSFISEMHLRTWRCVQ